MAYCLWLKHERGKITQLIRAGKHFMKKSFSYGGGVAAVKLANQIRSWYGKQTVRSLGRIYFDLDGIFELLQYTLL
jgi:hypothetical protein